MSRITTAKIQVELTGIAVDLDLLRGRFELLRAVRTYERLLMADAQRRARALEHLNRQRRTWYADRDNIRTLINAKLESVWVPREARVVVQTITLRPWSYRTEFVAARCRELDGKEAAVCTNGLN